MIHQHVGHAESAGQLLLNEQMHAMTTVPPPMPVVPLIPLFWGSESYSGRKAVISPAHRGPSLPPSSEVPLLLLCPFHRLGQAYRVISNPRMVTKRPGGGTRNQAPPQNGRAFIHSTNAEHQSCATHCSKDMPARFGLRI